MAAMSLGGPNIPLEPASRLTLEPASRLPPVVPSLPDDLPPPTVPELIASTGPRLSGDRSMTESTLSPHAAMAIAGAAANADRVNTGRMGRKYDRAGTALARRPLFIRQSLFRISKFCRLAL